MVNAVQYQEIIAKQIITIDAGQSISATIDTYGTTNASFQIPAGWTPCDITFLGSLNGSTFDPIEDADGNLFTVSSVMASSLRVISPTWLYAVDKIKIVCSVAQAGTVDVYLGLRALS